MSWEPMAAWHETDESECVTAEAMTVDAVHSRLLGCGQLASYTGLAVDGLPL